MDGTEGRSSLCERILEAAPIALIVADAHGRVRVANRAVEALFGYRAAELVGQPVDLLVPMDRRHGHVALRAGYVARPRAGLMGEGREVVGQRRDGTRVPLEIALTPIELDGEMLVLAAIVDVTVRRHLEDDVRRANAELEQRVRDRTAQLERAAAEREVLLADLRAQRAALERLSREDPLTGLANRRDFDERLAVEILRAERNHAPLAVAMLDLDRFKSVNDRFGHALGDTVLIETADLIRHHCRGIDVVGRYGGEEFTLALPGATLADGCHLCERIRIAFEQHDWERLRPGLAVKISAGVSEWHPGTEASALIARADANLYLAKDGGRNRVIPDL